MASSYARRDESPVTSNQLASEEFSHANVYEQRAVPSTNIQTAELTAQRRDATAFLVHEFPRHSLFHDLLHLEGTNEQFTDALDSDGRKTALVVDSGWRQLKATVGHCKQVVLQALAFKCSTLWGFA